MDADVDQAAGQLRLSPEYIVLSMLGSQRYWDKFAPEPATDADKARMWEEHLLMAREAFPHIEP